MKRILLAIPTAKYIEVETFKSIYDLQIPEGYDVTFQYYWGYNIDQVRNLIVSPGWASNLRFDYLFAVDSDIVLPQDCLVKMLNHDVDIVSGVYIQRIPGQENIEIYRRRDGGIHRITMKELSPPGLHPIDSCGFGCVLIKSDVLRKIPYPQFVYHSAIDHNNTISEDVDFCVKAAFAGAKMFVDSSIVCDHIGSTVYRVTQFPEPVAAPVEKESTTRELMRLISKQEQLIPDTHKLYLRNMRDDQRASPKVIFDIGANCLLWTTEAARVWPNAEIIAFDATDTLEFLYKERGIRYYMGVLSDVTGVEVDFYQNNDAPSGNSYYKENVKFSPGAEQLYSDDHIVKRTTITLDDVVALNKFPQPDLIKMDIQGAELDVLKGATNTLKKCKDLFLELQHKEYNIGSPHVDVVIAYLAKIGFKLVTSADGIDKNDVAGDYHFRRK